MSDPTQPDQFLPDQTLDNQMLPEIPPPDEEASFPSDRYSEWKLPVNHFEAVPASLVGEQEHAVVHDVVDRKLFQENLDGYQSLRDNYHSESLSTAPRLVEDLFYSFHRPNLTLVDPTEIKPSFQFNRELVEQLTGTEEHRKLREYTQSDELATTIATTSFAERVLATIDATTREQLEEMYQAEQALEKLFSQAESLEEASQHQTNPHKKEKLLKQAQKLWARAALAQTSKEGQQQAWQEYLNSAIGQKQLERTRQVSRLAATAAITELEELNAALAAYAQPEGAEGANGGTSAFSSNFTGVTNPTADRSIKISEKIELAQKLKTNPKLTKIAELCGRFRRIAMQIQKSKLDQEPDEVARIEPGKNFARLLKSQLVYLADPDLENLFYQKLLSKQLLERTMEKYEPQGRGPIIVALDSSGSMTTEASAGVINQL